MARFDDVVLAHAGFAAFSAEAVRTATSFAQVFLEPSWCPAFAVRRMLEGVGCRRMLFGSDHPENVPVEFARCAALGLSPAGRRLSLAAPRTACSSLEPLRLPHLPDSAARS